MSCSGCERKIESENGICNKDAYVDELPVRCVGEWSNDKHHYLKRYIEVFTKSMRSKWNLIYIDLFSGPGKCRVRESEEVIDGSPLIAVGTKFKFKKYYFVDFNIEALNSLKKRCEKESVNDKIIYINNDCNVAVNEIVDAFDKNMLGLAFIDPTGLNAKYQMIKKLSEKRIDLIINFPIGMAFKRNIKQALLNEDSVIDELIGTKDWRSLKKIDDVISFYENRIRELGYIEVKKGEMIRSKGNLPLYYLMFASKAKIAGKFWDEVNKINVNGQPKLPGM